MMRLGIAALVASLSVAAFVPPVFAAIDSYKIQSWPQDLDKVPCSAFRKNADGSWTPTAIIFVGGKPRKDAIAKDSAESQMLAARCR
jgi:hypothetical protein